MKIFITGGSGFLGSKLIVRLVKEKHSVLALSRNAKSSENLKSIGAEIVEGNFQNISEWEKSLNGIDTVIHCAAPIEVWGDWKNFYEDIVLNTKNLLVASDKQKVKRFIYISSESVLQDKLPLLDIDETFPYPEEPNSFYGKSKMLAEKEILNFSGSIESIILRPTFIWGKGVKALDTMVDKIKSGQFIWIGNGECLIEMVHVENVVEAISLSITKGKNKEIYNVTDDNAMTAKKFISALVSTRNISIPEKSMPGSLASLAAVVVEGVWKLFGIKSAPPLSRFELSFIAMPRRYNIKKIKSELGYKPIISLEQGLKEMAT